MDEKGIMIPVERIKQSIVLIRGQKVMLDRDLANLYEVKTRVLNQAVGRNIKRFPEDFMFALTRDEIMKISQIVTSSDIKYAKRVHAFTEQGVAMLDNGTKKRIDSARELVGANKKLIEIFEKKVKDKIGEV